MAGGKLAEGIDYKGEALNGVAVVGLPLAVYDDIQREINAYYTKKYGKARGMLIAYTLPAINRGLQAAGRVIRAGIGARSPSLLRSQVWRERPWKRKPVPARVGERGADSSKCGQRPGADKREGSRVGHGQAGNEEFS